MRFCFVLFSLFLSLSFSCTKKKKKRGGGSREVRVRIDFSKWEGRAVPSVLIFILSEFICVL